MQLFKKDHPKKRNTANARLVKKALGKDSGRRVFGFACSPDIPAQLKLLTDKLNVPIYPLAEHMLQLSAEVIAKAVENPEEMAILRSHLVEVHVEARTIEKLGAYDRDLADRLNEERLRRFNMDKAARQIVRQFMRAGLRPKEIAWAIDYGLRCRTAVARRQPIPTDLPPDED